MMPTMRAVLAEFLILQALGYSPTLEDECGNGMIADGRDLMVARFLAGTSDDNDVLAMLDYDVQWEPGALAALIEKPTDFRCGIYPQRKDPIDFCVRYDLSSHMLMSSKSHGMLRIWGAPAGFIVMSRRMLRLMTERYADQHYFCGAAPDQKVCGLFQPYWMRDVEMPGGKRGNIKLGEDYSFCQRWVDMGGEVWVEPKIKMGHTGLKTFSGSLHEHLEAKKAAQEAPLVLPEPHADAYPRLDLFSVAPADVVKIVKHALEYPALPQPHRAFA